MKHWIIALIAASFLAACGSNDEPEAVDEAELAAESTDRDSRREVRREPAQEPQPLPPRSGDPARNVPQIQGTATEEGYGLTMIVDGGSPEAFAESLELIAQDTTQEQYHQLDSALRFLRMYSSDGWSGTTSLYEALDGMSGEEIIIRANELRAKRAQRR